MASLLLHGVLMLWLLTWETAPRRELQEPAEKEGVVTVKLLPHADRQQRRASPASRAAQATSALRPRPKPVQRPAPRTIVSAPTESTGITAPAIEPAASAADSGIATSEPGEQAGVVAIDCMPLHWLQGMSRRISFGLHYPARSRRLGERGTAHVRVSVRRDGRVLDTVLLRGSGYPSLDQEAQGVFLRIARFDPVPLDACRGAGIVVIDQPIAFGTRPS